MKRFLLLAVCVLLASAASDEPYRKYIEKYAPTAVSEMKRTGVPASITLAQGLLESAAGQSELARKANNHFGIKCHNDWRGKKTYRDDDAAGECFRVYPHADASFRDHSDFLRYRDRYKALFELEPTDYKAWAHGLKAAGYATDPKYAPKLIKLIEDYRLYEYDTEAPVEELPEPPAVIERPVERIHAEAEETISLSLTRSEFEINGVPFIYSLEGDTYASLAASYGLFTYELLRFNDLRKEAPLKPGSPVFIQAKKARGPRGVPKYVAAGGESLRDISQRFGVRLQSLCRFNGVREDFVAQEGDTILLSPR